MTTASLLNKIPENTSLLQSTKFTFIIPELPFARYFLQSVSLPGVSTNPVTINTPFSSTYRHGDKLEYEGLTFNAIIDEDLRVWEETYKWLVSLTKPTKFSEYKKYYDDKASLYFDGILTLNTNANNPNIRIKFTNCHPVSLGAVQFSTTSNADTVLTADMNFRYDGFFIERL